MGRVDELMSATKEPMKTVSFRVSKGEAERLDKLLEGHEVDRGKLLRAIVLDWIDNHTTE